MSVFDLNNLNQKQNPNLSQIQLQNLNSLMLLNTYDKYMYLKLYIDDSDDLKNKYISYEELFSSLSYIFLNPSIHENL